MLMPLTISIAMATYNGERFIADQLNSFLKQVVLPNELVVTDDCSSDKTIEIIESFAATAPFSVRLIKNEERLGYRANFLKAASLCRCDVIAFSDQDDVWRSEKLARCIGEFSDANVLLVFHNAQLVDEKLNPLPGDFGHAPRQTMNAALEIEPRQFSLGFTLLFRRILLDFNDYWPISVDFSDERYPRHMTSGSSASRLLWEKSRTKASCSHYTGNTVETRSE